MLALDYGPDVPLAFREILEHFARSGGVSLAELEAAGSDLASAEAFILAHEATLERRRDTPATRASRTPAFAL